MHSRFDRFRATSLGRQLERLIDSPERYIEYAALSRAEVPAVSAIVRDLQKMFPDVQYDQTAKQFCGAMVAEVMRRKHHDVLRPRGRVPGDFFTYGAVWMAEPQRAAFDALLARLAAMPDEMTRIVHAVPAGCRRMHPGGTGFSLVEHICHLRDLDRDVYRERIARLLAEDGPALASVDGVAMAAERRYAEQDSDAALAGFRLARADLVAQLTATTPEQRQRYGIVDGVRRITLDELVEDIYHHDRTHILELDELDAETSPTQSQGKNKV
ncbi:DinB family protein [Massilia sp. P8910]|uniref:DinB family protein n=1 Tax=Massilia antarctica TaxID=2765360 RepID=UPI001E61F605|nr:MULTISPECIES: DinB family protein [Massilia]MCE3602216.1 DinB family protein [Massilia antarctica]MCY0914884.1 DinB family protein [Massilia sp. H27-R4]